MNRIMQKSRHAAFTLVEVLIAIAILGVGLIMVASIFPVAATWTRQAAEETVASQVALNAMNIMKTKLTQTAGLAWSATGYYPEGAVVLSNGKLYRSKNNNNKNSLPPSSDWNEIKPDAADKFAKFATIAAMGKPVNWVDYDSGTTYASGQTVYAGGHLYKSKQESSGQSVSNTDYWEDLGSINLSNMDKLFPLSERAYAFGSNSPYPAATPSNATYFWTALLRPGAGNDINVYIFVFRKGSVEQIWGTTPVGWVAADEIPGARDSESGVPTLVIQSFNPGTLSGNTISGAVPPVGYLGLSATSGTVFRQGLNAAADAATPSTTMPSTEQVIYAPPADGTTGSPLIYIYQTKLAF